MNIYESLAVAIDACRAVGKDAKNTYDGYNYRSIDAVMNAVSPALAKARIAIEPRVLEIETKPVTTSKGGTQNYTRVLVEYTFYAADGTHISAQVYGEGTDRGDKSINKAMSAAYKYCLFETLCIPTEEMVDSERDSDEVQAPEAHKKAPARQQNRQAQPQPKVQQRPAEAAPEPRRTTQQQEEAEATTLITDKMAGNVRVSLESYGIPEAWICQKFNKGKLEELTIKEYRVLWQNYNKLKAEYAEAKKEEA